MKYLFFLVILSTLFIQSCDDDLVFPPSPMNLSCDFELGRYKLAPTSLQKLPFHKTRVVFKDSLGNELNFRVIGNHYPNYDDSYAQVKGDHYQLFCYTTEYQTYTYTSDETPTQLYIGLYAKPAFQYPFNNNVADELYAYPSYPENTSPGGAPVFWKILDKRTSNMEDTNLTLIPEFTCFGNTFTNVEFASYGPLQSVYFNLPIGIVRFQDETGKVWCFDRFV